MTSSSSNGFRFHSGPGSRRRSAGIRRWRSSRSLAEPKLSLDYCTRSSTHRTASWAGGRLPTPKDRISAFSDGAEAAGHLSFAAGSFCYLHSHQPLTTGQKMCFVHLQTMQTWQRRRESPAPKDRLRRWASKQRTLDAADN